MDIKKVYDGSVLTVSLSGRIDAITALELDEEFKTILDGVTDLTLDFADLEYISSAGLRSLLRIQRRMSKQGQMRIKSVSRKIRVVFEKAGFAGFFTFVD